MKKIILFGALFLGVMPLTAQKKVEIKNTGLADKTIVISETGIQDYSILITNSELDADLTIGFTGNESEANYTITNNFEQETIRVKSFGFGDHSFRIKTFGSADVAVCINCCSNPDVLIYLDDWGNLSKQEILALVYQDILSKVD